MAVQIVAPKTVRLIETLSRLTGESAETSVEIAVQERLTRLRDSDEEAKRQAEISALIDELAALFREHPEVVTDHGELLYGEDGLPK